MKEDLGFSGPCFFIRKGRAESRDFQCVSQLNENIHFFVETQLNGGPNGILQACSSSVMLCLSLAQTPCNVSVVVFPLPIHLGLGNSGCLVTGPLFTTGLFSPTGSWMCAFRSFSVSYEK